MTGGIWHDKGLFSMTINCHPEHKNPVTLNSFQGLLHSRLLSSFASLRLTRSTCARYACYGGHRQLRFRPAQRGSQTHSGLRIRYGLRALRQAPRLPLSHFAHQSALLDYCVLATLNGLARNGRSLRSTPRKIRSPSLVKRSRAHKLLVS